MSTKRIVKELTEFVSHPPNPRFKVFPNVDDITFWKALIIGPPGSSYNKGVYMISIKFPNNYPVGAPTVRWVTPIYHCNISTSGRVCQDDAPFTTAKTISNILTDIDNLLLKPKSSNALDSTIAAEMLQTPKVYKKKAGDHAVANANKPLDELLAELLGAKYATDEPDEYKKKKEEM